MSANKQTYLGILIELPNKTKEIETYSHNSCPKCLSICKSKFCPECGTQTEIHYKKESKAVHISNILEENNLDEELIYKYEDCDYYRPNSSKYCLSRGYSFIFDNKFDFVGFINRYKEENKELIKVLEANFDFVNIYVGYQSYWS